ncbi:FAD-binding protein [bacterium]|nr:FAD-binding protein [candidate division CSSED10-310 bacterium]
MYRILPLGVVMPRDGDDVIAAVEIANNFNVSITARGAGVGLTGNALGHGLIIDFSRYMNRILAIDATHKTVRVEPGLVQFDLEQAVRKHSLFFPPDPSSNRYCTIGGMVANNAAGAHSIKYGATSQYVKGLSLVMSDGREEYFHNAENIPAIPQNPHEQLVYDIDNIIREHTNDVDCFYPKTTKNASGYLLADIVNPDDSINASRLFSASEGTLGLFTSIDLNLEDIPEVSGLMLLFCESLTTAGEAVVQVCQHSPSMLEIMEDTFLNLVRKSAFDVGIALPQSIKALLLVEFDGPDIDTVQSKLETVRQELVGPGRPAIAFRRGMTPEDKNKLLKVRHSASPILNRMPPPIYPARFIEDCVVPVEKLPDYILGLHDIFKHQNISGVIFGHAGDGHVHVNPFMDISDPKFKPTMQSIAHETFHLVKSLKGSLSGEHGDGFLRSPFLPDMFEGLYCAFEQIKKKFDPFNRFNPGIIVGGDNYRITDNLRIFDVLDIPKNERVINQETVIQELNKCSGCGACRAYCPVFLGTGNEMGTPRAKRNLLTWILKYGFIDNIEGIGPEEKSILDLCFGCGLCRVECPGGSDIPGMVQYAKEKYHMDWGLSWSEQIITSVKLLEQLGSIQSQWTNRVMKNSVLRRFLEKTTGLDRQRGIPAFDEESFQTKILHAGIDSSHPKVVYFPGSFANYHDSSGEASAIVYILKHHEFSPLVPNLECCDHAKFVAGRSESARKESERNVEVLYALVQKGYPIVTSSPACLAAIRYEYPRLLHSTQSKHVAEHTSDIHEFLVALLTKAALDTHFKPLPYSLALHQPCQAKAAGYSELSLKLLSLIPGLTLHSLESQCCGMGGTFGLSKRNAKLSRSIGKRLFWEIKRLNPDFVISSCGACRMQIEENTGIVTVHPACIIALSYGMQIPLTSLDLRKP